MKNPVQRRIDSQPGHVRRGRTKRPSERSMTKGGSRSSSTEDTADRPWEEVLEELKGLDVKERRSEPKEGVYLRPMRPIQGFRIARTKTT